jgi:hypothetical protein
MKSLYTTINIYDVVYDVRLISDKKEYMEVSDYKEDEYKNNLGFHRFRDSMICINVSLGMNEYAVIDTFIHEVVHAIYTIFGYEQEGKKFSQEFVCNFIAKHSTELERIKQEFISILVKEFPNGYGVKL